MDNKKTCFNIDYKRYIGWSSGFVAPSYGIAEATIESGTDGYPTDIAVNGETIPFCGRVSAGVSQYVAIIFLKPNDVLTYKSNSIVTYSRFFAANH